MSIEPNYEEQLVDHLPQIRRIVQRIAKRHDVNLIDDITQECCARIIEKEGLWDKNTNKISQWINMVTRNFTIDLINKQRRREHLERPITENHRGPENEELFSEDHIQWVMEQFKSLTNIQKTVLQMRYFQEMKVIDIAKELGISQPLASYHLKSALKSLKKRAKDQGLLAALLPWKWSHLKKGLFMSTKYKFLVGVFCFLGVILLTHETDTTQPLEITSLKNIRKSTMPDLSSKKPTTQELAAFSPKVPEPQEVPDNKQIISWRNLLKPSIPIVRGRIVDAQGNPVAGAHVSLQPLKKKSAGREKRGALLHKKNLFDHISYTGSKKSSQPEFQIPSQAMGLTPSILKNLRPSVLESLKTVLGNRLEDKNIPLHVFTPEEIIKIESLGLKKLLEPNLFFPGNDQTGSDGVFEIWDIRQRDNKPGYYIEALHRSLGTHQEKIIASPFVQDLDVGDITLQSGVDFKILVEDSHGKPLSGAWFYVVEGQQIKRSLQDLRQLTGLKPIQATDKSGVAWIRGLPLGSYCVIAGKPGFDFGFSKIVLEASDLSQKITVTLKPIKLAHVRVSDSKGPVENATVIFQSFLKKGKRTHYKDVREFTNKKGLAKLNLKDIPLHPHSSLRVFSEGRFKIQKGPITSSTTEIYLEDKGQGKVIFKLKDSLGQELTPQKLKTIFNVQLDSDQRRNKLFFFKANYGKLNVKIDWKDGYYVTGLIYAGDYLLTLNTTHSQDHIPFKKKAVVLADDTVDLGTLIIHRGCSIKGRLIYKNSPEQASGLFVYSQGPPEHPAWGSSTSAVSDGQGYFEINFVRPGANKLLVLNKSFLSSPYANLPHIKHPDVIFIKEIFVEDNGRIENLILEIPKKLD